MAWIVWILVAAAIAFIKTHPVSLPEFMAMLPTFFNLVGVFFLALAFQASKEDMPKKFGERLNWFFSSPLNAKAIRYIPWSFYGGLLFIVVSILISK
jgi:hypothetical protein